MFLLYALICRSAERAGSGLTIHETLTALGVPDPPPERPTPLTFVAAIGADAGDAGDHPFAVTARVAGRPGEAHVMFAGSIRLSPPPQGLPWAPTIVTHPIVLAELTAPNYVTFEFTVGRRLLAEVPLAFLPEGRPGGRLAER